MNVPKLRFKEFNDEWKNFSLDKLVSFSKGNLLSKADLDENGLYPCILYGQLYTKYSEVIRNVYSKTNRNDKNLIMSKYGDVLIPSSGETPLDISTASCIMLDNILLGGDINILSPTNCEGRFLSYMINNNKRKEIAKVAQGHSVVHLYNDNLKKISINIPQLNEQTKIANTLELLDKKIELQTKKIEDLKLFTKKLETQYIFNKQIEYSKKRIDDIFTVKAGGDISKTNVSFVKTPQFCYPIYSNNLEMNGLYGYSDIYKINEESITVTGRGDIGKAIKREGKYYPIVRLLVLIPKMDINLIYMQEAINNLTLIQESTGVPQLTAPQISRYEIHFPPLYIQEKYGKMLYLLQEKTMKELRKIEVLKQLKKGLIQNMFV